MKTMQSYIPGLPSIGEAAADHSRITSDHMPILAVIPNHELRIVSWNVLENDGGNGFAKNGSHEYGETEEQRNARHQRIADSLERIVKEQSPGFITLQEITGSSELLNKILARLPGYQCVMENGSDGNVADYCGNITLYLKGAFYPEKLKRVGAIGGYVTQFKTAKEQVSGFPASIELATVHSDYNENTLKLESALRSHLSSPEINSGISIVIGDFNNTVSPLDIERRNLTTSVSPSIFRVNENDKAVKAAIDSGLQVQGACAIDGCFYAEVGTGGDRLIQLNQAYLVRQINPETGKVCDPADLCPVDSVDFLDIQLGAIESEFPDYQLREINKYRLALSIDASFSRQYLGPNKTIASEEKRLQVSFNNQAIVIRPMVNLNNDKAIGVVVPQAVYNYFNTLMMPNVCTKTILDKENERQVYIVYAKMLYINDLLAVMNFMTGHENLLNLATQIQSLKLSGKINHDVSVKFGLLLAGLQREPKINEKPYQTVIDHFIGLTNELAVNTSLSLTRIDESSRELEAKLASMKPLNPTIKTIVCGVIGALVGLVLGFSVGAIMTCYAGGIGAIPGMLLGMVNGFTMGSAIALGTSVVGASAFGIAGFFSGRENDRKFQELSNLERNAFTALHNMELRW